MPVGLVSRLMNMMWELVKMEWNVYLHHERFQPHS